MKQKKLLLLIFNFLFIAARAQTLSETRAIAELQYSQGDYELAIPNLKRTLFFSNNNKTTQAKTIYLLAKSYFFTRNYPEAIYYFDQAYFSLENDSLKKECIFEKTLCLFAESKYQLALVEILSLDSSFQSPYFDQRRKLYLASLYYKTGDLSNSYVYFCQLINDNQQKKELDNYFKKAFRLQKNKPYLPMLMSFLAPGAGQFYIGDVQNGLNSFILNYALLFAFTYTALNYTVLDASLAFIPWIFRYYLGGVRKIPQLYSQKNNAQKRVIYTKILHLIKNK